MNLKDIVPNVYISSISYCTKMHKASLFSNVRKTFSCKIHCPDHQIDSHIMTWYKARLTVKIFYHNNLKSCPISKQISNEFIFNRNVYQAPDHTISVVK